MGRIRLQKRILTQNGGVHSTFSDTQRNNLFFGLPISLSMIPKSRVHIKHHSKFPGVEMYIRLHQHNFIHMHVCANMKYLQTERLSEKSLRRVARPCKNIPSEQADKFSLCFPCCVKHPVNALVVQRTCLPTPIYMYMYMYIIVTPRKLEHGFRRIRARIPSTVP